MLIFIVSFIIFGSYRVRAVSEPSVQEFWEEEEEEEEEIVGKWRRKYDDEENEEEEGWSQESQASDEEVVSPEHRSPSPVTTVKPTRAIKVINLN